MSRIVGEDNSIVYRNKDGRLHRLDGPAIEYANGHKEWLVNDERHRLDGPAVESAGGDRYWYENDKMHRLDGPAIQYANGRKSWYIYGIEYSEEDFNRRVQEIQTATGDK